jgi:GSH-dependent disulfide-bond oxidoreductase
VTDSPRFELLGMPSPNVRKIVLMLEELEADYAPRIVKVFRGEQFSDEFRALNPFSKVPVLIDHAAGDTVIFESGAILVYLAETFDRFLPRSGPARYATLTWLFAQVANVGPMFGQYNHFMGEGADAPGARERYRNISARIYRILDERLKAEAYLAGPGYSVADIATYHWAGYVEAHKMDWADFPNLARWRAEIADRPAAVREAEFLPRLIGEGADGFQTASQSERDRFWWRD